MWREDGGIYGGLCGVRLCFRVEESIDCCLVGDVSGL
jgi:hypothetical protein